jgi:hypothetical protein
MKWSDDWETKNQQEGFRSYEQSTLCKCPRCEKLHKMRIHWVGNGIPRKYCTPCRHVVDGIYIETIYNDFGKSNTGTLRPSEMNVMCK